MVPRIAGIMANGISQYSVTSIGLITQPLHHTIIQQHSYNRQELYEVNSAMHELAVRIITDLN